MKKCLSMFALGSAALGLALAPAVLGQSASRMAAADNTFATKAAEGGMAEVRLGNLAKTNASNLGVKSFGERMVTDHTKANDELKSIASKKGVELPSKEHTAKWTSDKAYVDMVVKAHEKDLAEFREEASSGSDPDVKKFADDTSKVIQEHLDLVKEIQGKLK